KASLSAFLTDCQPAERRLRSRGHAFRMSIPSSSIALTGNAVLLASQKRFHTCSGGIRLAHRRGFRKLSHVSLRLQGRGRLLNVFRLWQYASTSQLISVMGESLRRNPHISYAIASEAMV